MMIERPRLRPIEIGKRPEDPFIPDSLSGAGWCRSGNAAVVVWLVVRGGSMVTSLLLSWGRWRAGLVGCTHDDDSPDLGFVLGWDGCWPEADQSVLRVGEV